MTFAQEDDLLRRITSDPEIFGGKPIIRGRRLSVEHVLTKLGVGETARSLLEAYPFLEEADIQACLLYGARASRHGVVMTRPADPAGADAPPGR